MGGMSLLRLVLRCFSFSSAPLGRKVMSVLLPKALWVPFWKETSAMLSSPMTTFWKVETRVNWRRELGCPFSSGSVNSRRPPARQLVGSIICVRSTSSMTPADLVTCELAGWRRTWRLVRQGWKWPSRRRHLAVMRRESLKSTQWALSATRTCWLTAFCRLFFHHTTSEQGKSSSSHSRCSRNSISQYTFSLIQKYPTTPAPTHPAHPTPPLRTQLTYVVGSGGGEGNTEGGGLQYSIMNWYASPADLKGESDLKTFLGSGPSVAAVFELPNFLMRLANQNKHDLHDYLSKSMQATRELANFISQPPADSDSPARKFKYPCMAMQVLEIDVEILKNFLVRASPAPLVQAFQNILAAPDPLPLLCGYFHTLNYTLHSKIPHECVALLYENSELLVGLARCSQNRSLMQVVAIYLNLQETIFKSQMNRERLLVKLEVVRVLMESIRTAVESGREEEEIRVENICSVLMEITSHYHLIVDGRAMLDSITGEAAIHLLWDIFMRADGFSLAIAPLLREVMLYYVLSSFNTEDRTNIELARRNQERLDSLPFVKRTAELLPVFLQQTLSASTLSLWHLRGVEIFNLAASLSSRRVANGLKATNYFMVLIGLLTKHDSLSILHIQVLRVFQTVFALSGQPDRLIYREHRKWMFTEGGLIEATMGLLLKRYGNLREGAMPRENSFPFLFEIIRVYVKLQTNDEEVSNFIEARSALFSDFINNIRKPYEAIIPLEDNDRLFVWKIPEPAPLTYTITKNFAEESNEMGKTAFFEEVNREEHMNTFISPPIDKPTEESMFPISKFEEMTVTTSFELEEKQAQQSSQPQIMGPINPVLVEPITAPPLQEEPPNNPAPIPVPTPAPSPAVSSYQEFLSKQKAEVDVGLKLQRSNSAERRLSANKSRVTSPSPKKKKWDDIGTTEEDKTAPKLTAAPKQADPEAKKQKISLTTQSARPNIPTSRIPPIPHHHANSHPPAEPKQTKIEPPEATQPTIPTTAPTVSPLPFVPPLPIQSLPSPPRSPERVTTDEASPRLAISKSTYQLSSPVLPQDIQRLSKSDMNLKELRNIQFRKERVARPQKSEYRRVEKRDELLLNFLGVQY